MPNEEHLSILKQGADVWNRWRKDNPDVDIDINGIRLNEVDLRGANFDHVSLINSVFNNNTIASQVVETG
jgi:uncharacterized protein YjbI with pentapeptide repeats